MKKYHLRSILLFWFGFVLVIALLPFVIMLSKDTDYQYTGALTVLMFVPPALSWGMSCYYDEMYRKKLIEIIKDDVQKYLNEHPRKVDEMSENEIIFIYNKYIKK